MNRQNNITTTMTHNVATRFIRIMFTITLLWLANANAFADATKESKELDALLDEISEHSEPDTAKKIAMMDKAMKLARQVKDNKAIAMCYFHHISFVVDINNMEYSQKKLNEFEDFVNKTGVGMERFYDAWMNVVNTYVAANRTMSAAVELKRMLNHATQHKSAYGMANAYTMFGTISDSYETAMKDFSLALKYMTKVGNPVDIAYIQYSMAMCCLNNYKYDEVLVHAAKMREQIARKDFNDPHYYTRIADRVSLYAYTGKGDKENATIYYKKLKKLVDDKQLDSDETFYTTDYIVRYIIKFDDPDKMWIYFKLLENQEQPEVQLGVLMEYYKAKGDYKKAYEAYEKYDSIITGIMIEKQRQDFLDANAQLNNVSLEQRNERLALDNAIKTSQIEVAVIIILILSGAAGAAGIFMQKRKNKQLAAERDNAEQARIAAEKEKANAEQARKNEEKARKIADGMSEMKTTFIKNISHEIRTPLNAIVGFNDLLNNQDMEIGEEDRKEMFAMMCEKTDQLLKLSDQVMTISRIDGNDLQIEMTALPLCAICDTARELTAKKLAPGVELKAKYQDMEQKIITDMALMTQVLVELLDNAAKYTKHGSITLSYRKRDKGKVEIAVEDTGIGIAPENATLAFERFEKLGSYEQGFGLGLSICQGLLAKLGGTISLDTSYTQGTRMVVIV